MLCFVFAQRERMQAYKCKPKEKENFYRYACACACAYACINPFSRLNKRSYALVSGKPRTLIPGECGALAGGFSGFGLSLLPRYAGFSTAFGASIGERGP